MANLKDFVSRVSQDQTLRDQYLADPQATMTSQGLSKEEQDAVMSGDRARVASMIDPDADGATAFGISVNVLVILGVS